jgi:hypothetical protein
MVASQSCFSVVERATLGFPDVDRGIFEKYNLTQKRTSPGRGNEGKSTLIPVTREGVSGLGALLDQG